MKQSEIVVGKSYLFHKTDIDHRKDLEGTIVTITGSKRKGKGRVNQWTGEVNGGWIQYITDTGRKVGACELREIPQTDNGIIVTV